LQPFVESLQKSCFVVAAVCDRRASFGFPRIDGGRRPPLQAFAEISPSVVRIRDLTGAGKCAKVTIAGLMGAYWYRPCEHARGGMPRTMRWPR